jgi:hypothetical protein
MVEHGAGTGFIELMGSEVRPGAARLEVTDMWFRGTARCVISWESTKPDFTVVLRTCLLFALFKRGL